MVGGKIGKIAPPCHPPPEAVPAVAVEMTKIGKMLPAAEAPKTEGPAALNEDCNEEPAGEAPKAERLQQRPRSLLPGHLYGQHMCVHEVC